MTAAFVSTLLLLGIVGYAAGWVAAGNELEGQGQTDPTASAQPSKHTPSPTPPARPSSPPTPTSHNATPTGTPSRPDQFEMPNLLNKDFRAARIQARALKLGVNITFNEPSAKPDGTVVKTKPDAGIYVWPGVTIQLYVVGPPPQVTVPGVAGLTCDEAKDKVLDAGLLIIDYPSGTKGNAVRLEPEPGTTVKWNDGVKIFCAQ